MILVIDHPIHLRFRMFSQSLTHDPWVKPTPIPVWLLGRSRHPPGSVPSVFGQMSIPLSIGPILCIAPIGRIYIYIVTPWASSPLQTIGVTHVLAIVVNARFLQLARCGWESHHQFRWFYLCCCHFAWTGHGQAMGRLKNNIGGKHHHY